MEVKTFENIVNSAKVEFRSRLEQNDNGTALKYAKSILDLCCSEFEESTMIENLRDVASDYFEEKMRVGAA